MHMKTRKSGCFVVSTMSARSLSMMLEPKIIVAKRLSTESGARLISSRRIQSPFWMLLISVPSTNWKMKPPPESSFCARFCRSLI